MQRLLSLKITDLEVLELYSNIIPKCGKRGHEVNHVSGTNGPVVAVISTRHLLHVLRSDMKLFSRKEAQLSFSGELMYTTSSTP
jgi:hypothetical protein